MSQLPADCLNEIFEYLDDEMPALYSCMLVNHQWCESSVRVFWRDVWVLKIPHFRTLIACLPNESKEILYKNGIVIPPPTPNPPMFNYAKFCKVISTKIIHFQIEVLLKSQQSLLPQNLENNISIVLKEIYKMYMSQIGSLQTLTFWANMTFDLTTAGAKDCLKHVSELVCGVEMSSEYFYQLSQLCPNLSSICLLVKDDVSKGLLDFISSQNNLKKLDIRIITENQMDEIIPLLKNLNNLKTFIIYGRRSVSFIAQFTNLQELDITFNYEQTIEELQNNIFPQLQILKIQNHFANYEVLINFLKNNGKNLKELYVNDEDGYCDNSLNLSISKFCPNIRKLSIGFKKDGLETLIIVLKNFQYLEYFTIWCGKEFLSEKEALEAVVKYSNKNFYELILDLNFIGANLLPEDLESFFNSWKNRIPQKSLSFVITNYDKSSVEYDHNMKIVEKYSELGVIKFKIIDDFSDLSFTSSGLRD
ncbi:hypothetical protein C1645_876899 [Glomus cerebriforme]|uniref:F-box domain-containing protein n=1 Tax=Glomus cerebriforme TaxID=658196 RepID=A0A397T1W3_9GLOM|nr:hypothetical protein C1645_876899 [Glomus cerebriforme]